MELNHDPVVVEVYRDQIIGLGRTPVPRELEAERPLGSTDMGNVTRVLPGIHPIIGIDSGGAVTHQPEFAAAAVTVSADAAIIDDALALAATASIVATDPAHRARLLELAQRRIHG